MARSLYKGPFINDKLLRKAILAKKKKIINIYTRSRSSTITFDFIGLVVHVYNGIKYFPLKIQDEMLGYKFGEFIFTKKRMVFRKKKKKKK